MPVMVANFFRVKGNRRHIGHVTYYVTAAILFNKMADFLPLF